MSQFPTSPIRSGSRSFQTLQDETKSTKFFHKNLFDISITSPKGLNLNNPFREDGSENKSTDQTTFESHKGDFHVLSCTTPGRQVGTEEKAIWGPVYNIPSERIYSGDFEMTCLYSQKLHKYITDWMNSIKQPVNGTNGYFNDRVQYYDQIVGDMVIGVYANNGKGGVFSETTYRLKDCFPVTINGLELNAGSQNEYQTMSVSWSFREFEIEFRN
jgi:hypothetical protein